MPISRTDPFLTRFSNLHWKGNSGPLNVRAFEGRVFLITFDRVSKGIENCEFRYYAQVGDELEEIPPTQFPKSIAGQNLCFGQRYFGGMDRQRDSVQIARDLEVNDIYFRQSLTAYVWNHLATGQQYWQSSQKGEISQALLEDYVRTNLPIKLTTVIRNAKSSQTKAQSGGDSEVPRDTSVLQKR